MKSIFISSTFRDMQYERDAIHTKIIPTINAEAQEFGESVSACDLRWGIDTSEMTEKEKTQKVLKVCLSEIDRCRPYMIVILGYRYGWIPESNTIIDVIKEVNQFEIKNKEISATALEVEYGAFFSMDNISQVLFYFREIDGICNDIYKSEGKYYKEKLEMLKARIKATPGVHYRTYHVNMEQNVKEGMERFSSMVIDDLRTLLKKEWIDNAKLDLYEVDQKKQRNVLIENCSQFVARKDLVEKCIGIIQINKTLFIEGIAGSGKSTLISKIGHELEQMGHKIVPIYCGYTSLTCSGFDILKYIIWMLEVELKKEIHFADSPEENKEELASWYEYENILMEEYTELHQKELTFLIDGMDQLFQDEICKELGFMPRKDYKNIHFVLSMISPLHFSGRISYIEIPELTIEECKEVVKSIANNQRREIPNVVLECLVERENAKSPLYINLIVQRLIMMDCEDFAYIANMGRGIDAIIDYQLSLIKNCPATLEDISVYILNHASGLIGGKVIKEILELLAVSRRGLRISDIEKVLKKRQSYWNQLDLTTFIKYMRAAFIYRSDGRIDFAHDSIRQGYCAQCNNIKKLHQEIANCFYYLDKNDDVRRNELVWHLIQADMKDEFVSVIVNYLNDKVNMEDITQDVVNAVIEDEGEWLIIVVKEYCFTSVFGFLSQFIGYNLFYGLIDTKSNLLIKVKLAEVLLDAAQKRCSVQESYGNIWEITIACDRLADVYRTFGSNDYNELALKCSNHSLMVREQLIEMFKDLDTVEKQREYICKDIANNGLVIQDEINDDQIQEMTNIMLNEIYRGIGVAHKDISECLMNAGYSQLKSALDHIKQSICIAEDIIKSDSPVVTFDVKMDLFSMNRAAADICKKIGDEQSIAMEEEYRVKAIQISETRVQLNKTNKQLENLCSANLDLAKFYIRNKGEKFEEGLRICEKIKPIVEKLYYQERTLSSQYNMVDLYNVLGDFYDMKDDYLNKEATKAYREKCLELMKDIASKKSSVEVKSDLVLLHEKAAESISGFGERTNINRIIESYEEAFKEAYQIFSDFPTEKWCKELNYVYDSVIQTIQNLGYRDETLNKRIIMELELCKLNNLVKISRDENQIMRNTIFRYNKYAENLQELSQLSKEMVPADLVGLMNSVGISIDILLINNAQRAFEISGVALKLSEKLVANSHSLVDRDGLAVSLAKYSTLCLINNSEHFLEVNNRLLALANELYDETKKEKYLQMIAMGELGNKVLSPNKSDNGNLEDIDIERILFDIFGRRRDH